MATDKQFGQNRTRAAATRREKKETGRLQEENTRGW
jgi:hypothetical protein